ncbi:MAG: S16 family serine protease, partial [Candidatus Binatia bacterium]
IGGLKEKCLAALHAGIKTIILPERNEKDLGEIPKQVRRKLTLITAKNMSDVLKASLLDKESRKKVSVASDNRAKTAKKRRPKRKDKSLDKLRRERTIPLRA